MASESPFGHSVRMRVLADYFARFGDVTAANAWEHVYRCLLWVDQAAGLAHIYDSNHMQAGRVFHGRAAHFTDELCTHWNLRRKELGAALDQLFKGCVEEWKRTRHEVPDPELESELVAAIDQLLRDEGLTALRAKALSQKIELLSKDFFTIGNKRKNALGEGFEDLLYILLQRVSKIPAHKLALRQPVSRLPGFRKNPPLKPGGRASREPHPDIAIVDGDITHAIITAKWSTRQDRETQFQAEYNSYQLNRTQTAELRFILVTNEFDVARLSNLARAIPGGEGGYVFHNIVHINPSLLTTVQGTRIAEVGGWLTTGKIVALQAFLTEMGQRFGEQ